MHYFLDDLHFKSALIKKGGFIWNSIEAEIELRKSAAQEVKKVLEGGKSLSLVNKEVLKYYQ